MDTYSITVAGAAGNTTFKDSGYKGQPLLSWLRERQIFLSAVCGGRGVCGKCVVRITEGCPPASKSDHGFFAERELAQGYRLACHIHIEGDMTVFCQGDEQSDFQILNSYEMQEVHACDAFVSDDRQNGPIHGIAVDIGTTTIAFELIDISSGRRIRSHTMLNRQRALGADVITRIKQACEGHLATLGNYVREDLCGGITNLMAAERIGSDTVHSVTVTGNTTMLHLLLGVQVHSLGQYPFTPVFTDWKDLPFYEVFGTDLLHCTVSLLPCISTYVGADITAGIVFCGGLRKRNPCVLMDLGTNGEMALFSESGITATSTAAGPAFEAGNISCGTGSVKGAIAKAIFLPETGVYRIETIGDAEPIGICGSGVLDIGAQMVAHGLVDETGLLCDEYFDDGFPVAPKHGIVFTQKDVRELQLAKSAVRSGLEVLLASEGLGYGQIETLYLAGGFGYRMNLESALVLGIIPYELRDRVVAVGNSALGGCAMVLMGRQAREDIKKVAGIAKEINLSADWRFNDLFMEHMMF